MLETPSTSASSRSELNAALKAMVLQECNVRGVRGEDIGDEDLVIGGKGSLQLDSLDAVEIVSALERQFGIRLESAGDARQVFRSFQAMSDYVVANASAEKTAAFVATHSASRV